MDQNNLEEERVYLVFMLILPPIVKRSQNRNSSRNLEAEVKAEAMEKCCLLAHFMGGLSLVFL